MKPISIMTKSCQMRKWRSIFILCFTVEFIKVLKSINPLQQVLITGGFGPEGYVQTGDIFDLDTGTWISKSFFNPKGGSRINHGCGTVNQ